MKDFITMSHVFQMDRNSSDADRSRCTPWTSASNVLPSRPDRLDGYHGGTMGVPWGYHGDTMGVPWGISEGTRSFGQRCARPVPLARCWGTQRIPALDGGIGCRSWIYWGFRSQSLITHLCNSSGQMMTI